jgi:hypothetical protein
MILPLASYNRHPYNGAIKQSILHLTIAYRKRPFGRERTHTQNERIRHRRGKRGMGTYTTVNLSGKRTGGRDNLENVLVGAHTEGASGVWHTHTTVNLSG